MVIGICTFHKGHLNDSVFLFSSVQLLSRVRLFVTPWIAAHQASLSVTNSRSSLRLASIESVMPSSHLILCHPLLLLPPIPPSIRVFSNESTLCTVQGTLKSLLQHHSSKASILQHSAFFTVQLSHPYMTTGKIIEHIWKNGSSMMYHSKKLDARKKLN